MSAEQRPSFSQRRRAVILTLAYCAANVQYLILFGESTPLANTLANALTLLAGGVIGAWVFGETYHQRGGL